LTVRVGVTHTQVAIVGAGLSGLALGYHLRRAGVDVCVLEARDRAGGNIRSERHDGYLCEWGPNGFLDNEPASLRLVDALGLGERLVKASDAFGTRWVVRNGKPRALPRTPLEFLRSDVLSTRAKARVLLEWAQPARRDGVDESVFDFAARRIGDEAARVLVDAMVTGIYAGDSKQLSLVSTFPRMRELEQQHGGLFRAMRRTRRAAARRARAATAAPAAGGPFGPGSTLCTFRDGMETLPLALGLELGAALRLQTTPRALARDVDRWTVDLESGDSVRAERVVIASPAWAAATLLRGVDAGLVEELAAIPSAPVAIVFLGFADDALRDVEPGFGFLVPAGEQIPVLGTLYESWVFPNRAPSGHALFRVLIGGARDPQAVDATDEQLVARALDALSRVLRLDATPAMTYVVRQRRGIPQYVVGHAARLQRIDAALARHPGLALTGYSYHGVAMNACMKHAEELGMQLGPDP
jgi:oxygen-dependent protoporphyrinogen oxidase